MLACDGCGTEVGVRQCEVTLSIRPPAPPPGSEDGMYPRATLIDLCPHCYPKCGDLIDRCCGEWRDRKQKEESFGADLDAG